jgi:hypothetical protein
MTELSLPPTEKMVLNNLYETICFEECQKSIQISCSEEPDTEHIFIRSANHHTLLNKSLVIKAAHFLNVSCAMATGNNKLAKMACTLLNDQRKSQLEDSSL